MLRTIQDLIHNIVVLQHYVNLLLELMSLLLFIEVVVQAHVDEASNVSCCLQIITSHVSASILSGLPCPNCTGSHRSLTTKMSLIFDFHIEELELVSLNMPRSGSSIYNLIWIL